MSAMTRRLTDTPLTMRFRLGQMRHSRSRSAYLLDLDLANEGNFYHQRNSSFDGPIPRRTDIIRTNPHARRINSLIQSSRTPCTGVRRSSVPALNYSVFTNPSSCMQSRSQSLAPSNRISIIEIAPSPLLAELYKPHSPPHFQEEEDLYLEDTPYLDSSSTDPTKSLQAQLQELELEYIELREEQERMYLNMSLPALLGDTLMSPFTDGWSWGS